LSKQERIKLVSLERNFNKIISYDPYLPDGYGDCLECSSPSSDSLCLTCLKELNKLVNKGNGLTGGNMINDIENNRI
jgi:hypothetical protein